MYLLPQHPKCWATWIYRGGLKNTVFEQRQDLSIVLGTAGIQNIEEGTWLLSLSVVLSPRGPGKTIQIYGEHRVLKDTFKKAHVAKSVTLDNFF